MGRPTISSLERPPRRYRPDLHMPRFETVEEAQREDARRAAFVSTNPINDSRQLQKRKGGLYRALKASASGTPAVTPVSKLFMREFRIRTHGALWQLVDECTEPVSTFTIIKRSWIRFPDNIDHLDPVALKADLRTSLNRAGAKHTSGFLYASLDGEFMQEREICNPRFNGVRPALYQVHFQGIASGEKIEVIDRLRKQRCFAPWMGDDKVRGCRTPVQLSREPLTNLPSPLAYTDKGFWKMQRNGKTLRIPEPHHTQVLLTLNDFRIEDLTLLMNLKVKAGKLLIAH